MAGPLTRHTPPLLYDPNYIFVLILMWQMEEAWQDHVVPSGASPPCGEWAKARAVDLGAAPGGWTEFLR